MDNKWMRLLAYVTGLVNQELLLQNEYLAAENRILKTHLQPGFRLTDGERTTLAEIGKRLGRKALQKVAGIAKPDTLLLLGTTGSSLTSSTDRISAGRWDDHVSTRRSRIWWFGWQARIPAGNRTPPPLVQRRRSGGTLLEPR